MFKYGTLDNRHLGRGFVHIAAIENPMNGIFMPVSIDIHGDDIDWIVRGWQTILELDWKIYKEQCNRI
jgi:hypothetical protein